MTPTHPLQKILGTPAVAAFVCLATILCFHSPRWWIMKGHAPETFEWARGLAYLSQCESPFRTDVEPAMRWRFLPQIIVWACHGGRGLGLAFPWIGVWALITYLFVLARDSGRTAVDAFVAVVILASTAPVLVSTGWLGFNDAWVALGLCYAAFGRSAVLLVLICVLCPFIDERFIFGLPCAFVLRNWGLLESDFRRGAGRAVAQCVCGALPFLSVRLLGAAGGRNDETYEHFIFQSVRGSTSYLWFAPLGFWMALRFAAFPAVQRLVGYVRTAPRASLLLVSSALIPVAIGFSLASDTVRTAGILLPLCAWGVLGTDDKDSSRRNRWLAVASLVVPVAHVTFTKVVPINSLPVELWRLLR